MEIFNNQYTNNILDDDDDKVNTENDDYIDYLNTYSRKYDNDYYDDADTNSHQ